MKAHVIGTSGKCVDCGQPVNRDLVVLCDLCLSLRLLSKKLVSLFWVKTSHKDLIIVNEPPATARWN